MILKKQNIWCNKKIFQTELNGTQEGSVCTIIKKRCNMVRNSETEPVWSKYITEDNLPTEDLKYLCSIIGLEATKKLMFNLLKNMLRGRKSLNNRFRLVP